MSDKSPSWREPEPFEIDKDSYFLDYLKDELNRYDLDLNLEGIRQWYNKCACYHNQSSPGADESLVISVILAQYFSEKEDYGTIEIEAYMNGKDKENAAKPDILIKNGDNKSIDIMEAIEVESKKPTRSDIVRKMRLLRKHDIENVMFGIPYSKASEKKSIEWIQEMDERTENPIVDNIFLVHTEYFDEFMNGDRKADEIVKELSLKKNDTNLSSWGRGIQIPESRLTDQEKKAADR